jgi:hypothetical protein
MALLLDNRDGGLNVQAPVFLGHGHGIAIRPGSARRAGGVTLLPRPSPWDGCHGESVFLWCPMFR